MFTVDQTYTVEGLAAFLRVRRQTVSKGTKLFRIFCWVLFVVVTLAYLLCLAISALEPGDPLLFLAPVMLLLFALLLIFEDRLNGWIMYRRMIPGTVHSVTVFSEKEYTVSMDVGQTTYRYVAISALRETEKYIFLFLTPRHGQIFEKACLQPADIPAFRAFLEERSQKSFP